MRYTRPKYPYRVYHRHMTTLRNTLGFDHSDKAKFRLHCIQLYEKLGWEGLVCAFPQLKKRTFMRWRKDFLASGGKLSSLVPKSTRPHRVRSRSVDPKIVAFIRSLRQKHPRLGKAKLVDFVAAFCTQHGLDPIGETTIGEVIREHHLFYAGKAVKGKQRRASLRLKRAPRASSLSPGYIQLDGTKVYAIDRYYHFLTAIDVVTKQAWVKVVPTFSSKHASLFLAEIQVSSLHPIYALQTDNGSEFAGLFSQAVASDASLLYFHSYPKSPQTNAYVERFNWTLQDEFLSNCEAFLTQETTQLKQELQGWLDFYHRIRPHQSLAKKTPYQYAVERQRVPYVCD